MHVVRRFIVIPVGRRAAVATLSNRRSVSTSTSLSPYSPPLPRWQRLRDAARRGATSEAEAAARAVLQADGAAAAVAVAAYTQLLWAYAADRDPDGVHAVARRAALLTPPEHPGLDAAVVREAARVARARAAAGCGVAAEPAQPAAAPSAQLQEAAAAHGFEAAYALALRFAHGEGGEGEKRRAAAAAAAARSAGVAYALLGAARRAGQAAQVARAYELPGRLRAGATGEVGGAGGGGGGGFCGSPQFLRAAMEASCNECDDPGAGLRLYHLRASEAHRRSFAVARSYVACLLRMTEGEQEVEEEVAKDAEWWNAECRRRLRRSRRRRRYNSGGDVTEATTARASRAVAAAEQEGAGQDSEPRARGVGRSQAQHAVPAYVGLARLAARRRDLPLVEVEAALRHVFWRARKHGRGGADVVREQLEAVYRRRAQAEGASPVLSPPLHYGGCGADERRKKRCEPS